MYFVYLIEHPLTGNWQVGYTNDLGSTLLEHDPESWKLVYYEYFTNRSDAKSRMYSLNTSSGKASLRKKLLNHELTRCT